MMILKNELIKEIEKSFLKEKDMSFLHFIKLGYEKKLLKKDDLDFLFLKSIKYCQEQKIKSIYDQIDYFGLTKQQAASIIESYIEIEIRESSFEMSHYFLIVEEIIIPVLKAHIPLKEELFLHMLIKNNLSECHYDELVLLNKENQCIELNKSLSIKRVTKKTNKI